MHSCPHPLWQHFSSLGQSLSLEQNSAHIPEPQRLRGHTPGLAEGKQKSIYHSKRKSSKYGVWVEGTVHDWFPCQFSHWEELTKDFNSCQLEKKLNIVARTESRRDTDSSTVKNTAFVVCRTVFITHTPLMWWNNIKETWAVAWFWKNSWEKEAMKQKRKTSA